MSERRPTAHIISKEKGLQLLQVLREDSAKNSFVCGVVAKAVRACGFSDEQERPGMQVRICSYIWAAKNIPEQDKPYAVAKILYGRS